MPHKPPRDWFEYTGYSSHLPWLAACVAATSGPVLELGAGDHSTVMLHILCRALSRKLITLDSDPEWLSRFGGLAGADHLIQPLPSAEGIPLEHYGVALVDNEPAETRGEMVDLLRGHADIIVCHDATLADCKWGNTLNSFRYRADCVRLNPQTTAVSDTIDLRFLDLPGPNSMGNCPSYGNQQIASYATHLPWLAACFMHTEGLVIEFGSGDNSTNMLHTLCAAAARPLITLESDREFAKRFLGDLDGVDRHAIAIPVKYSRVEWGEDVKIGLVFIDCEPAEQRGLLLEQYRDRAQIIVCHNTESPAYNYDFAPFKYRVDCDRIFPMTTACSMTKPLDFLSLPGNVRNGGLTYDGEVVVWSQR